MCSRELCEAMQRQDRRQPPRIKTQRESGAEAAKHVSLPKTATEDITLLGQGPRYCVGEDGRRLLAESVDPSSIATSMDDQLSTNPDDCDGQRRPGLSVLIISVHVIGDSWRDLVDHASACRDAKSGG